MALPMYETPMNMPGLLGSPSGGGMEGLLGNPLFNIGLGILANNRNGRNPGTAIGSGLLQGVQSMQQNNYLRQREALNNLQTQHLRNEIEQNGKKNESMERLLQGDSAYTTMQEVPETSVQNVPIPPLPGAVAPNFGLRQEQVTTTQQKPVFNDKQYRQDLVYAGFGDDLIKSRLAPTEANYDIAPDGTMYDKKTGRVVAGQRFNKPESENMPSEVKEYEFAVNQGYKGTFRDWQLELKKAGAASNNVNVNTGQKGFDNTLKLRGDFRSEPIYKAHQDVKSAHSQITAALGKASPAGDLAGATKIMKILDPGSVVRESELGMAMAASGALDRLYNYADMTLKGTKLTPSQRKDFQELADSLYSESANLYNAKRNEYQGIAERNGLNVEDVLGDPDKVQSAAQQPKIRKYNPKTGRIE